MTALFMGHPAPAPTEVAPLRPVYAAPAERSEVRTLRSGQTLGEILASALTPTEQAAVVMAFQERASARRLVPGTEVTFRYRADDEWLRGVDVKLNPDSTVRLDRDDFGWHTSVVRTPIFTDTIFAAGTIEDALWNAIVGSPGLEEVHPSDRTHFIFAFEEIFRWQLDFTRQIQKGDYYRFVFERKVRPDGTMQGGTILAAELVNGGKSLHAIRFDVEGDGGASYYDLEGRSLRRAFLTRPLSFRRISSRFTNARLHPVLGTWRAHRGVDYAADSGTPVEATADGTVVQRGVSGGYGNLVEIQHANGYRTRYAHLRGFAQGLRVGSRVSQGDVIGFVGMTGLATGPHLHYEMLQNGRQIDPLSAQIPSGEPVPSSAFERWSREMVGQLALLEVLPGAHQVRYATGLPETPPVGGADDSP
jgi:murein DD-endopeptidase MepM/ murein hydrolase activator NlpD